MSDSDSVVFHRRDFLKLVGIGVAGAAAGCAKPPAEKRHHVRALPERPDYAPPSRFPEVRQDLALLVDAELPAGKLVEIVRAHRSGAVRIRGEVFDEYKGKGVPEGTRSLAIRLTFGRMDRTLTDAEIAKPVEAAVADLSAELGAALRA